MYQFPIGVMVESYKSDFRTSLEKAVKAGAQGLQMYCTYGTYNPDNMTPARIAELLDMVKSYGLKFSAICGDLGGGFGDPQKNPERVERSKRIMELAKKLECDIVTTHIGVVPSDKSVARYGIMQDACRELAEFADGIRSHFAIETGPETSAVLKEFLDSLGSRGVSVNLDPANLVMVTGDDPVQAVYNLKDYIVHTHAKDGIKLRESNPEYIYKACHPIPEEYRQLKFFEEVPLGTGNVPFPAYLRALEDIGYRGFLTIERECGEDPEKDINIAANYLRKCMEEA